MKVCFIGHRTIQKTDELIQRMRETVKELIRKGVKIFLFGSVGAFNDLSWQIVSELKKEYPFIQRVYVRATYSHIEKFYEEYLLQSYEITYFPPQIEKAGRCAYVERNRVMIDESAYCIFYYNEEHLGQKRRRFINNTEFLETCKSGTKIALDYAVKKRKNIINVL